MALRLLNQCVPGATPAGIAFAPGDQHPLLVGAYAAQTAQAQGRGAQRPTHRRLARWRAALWLRNPQVLRRTSARSPRFAHLDREWNPTARIGTEGRLREVQDREARAGCR